MEKSIYLEAKQLESINNSDDNLQFNDQKEDSILEAISEGEELEEFGFSVYISTEKKFTDDNSNCCCCCCSSGASQMKIITLYN